MENKNGIMRIIYKIMRVNKNELSWVMYDVGNSAFTMLISSFIPIYFGSLYKSGEIARLGGEENLTATMLEIIGNTATEIFSLGTVISTLVVAVAAPFLGAMADYKGMKKRLFIAFLAIGVLFGALMGVVNTWMAYLIMFILAKIGYSSCNIFYDSMLTDITTEERFDSVSSKGYAWGYIGSCIPFICSVMIYMIMPDSVAAVKTAQILTIIWWIVMTIPLLKNVKHTHFRDEKRKNISGMIKDLGTTLKSIFRDKVMFLFMIAYFFYIDGVYTVISMAVSYGEGLGLDSTGMILALLVTQLVAFPCVLISGKLSKKLGVINMLRGFIVLYIGICIFGFFMTTNAHFWIMAISVGMAQGGIQALSRSYFAKLVPKNKSNEYFGLFDIFGKAADILGPFLIFIVSSILTSESMDTGITQGARYGVLSLTLLFAVGFVLLSLMQRSKNKNK